MGVPGLKIVTPATPADAKGLLRSAIQRRQPGALLRAQAPLRHLRRRQRRARADRRGPHRAGGNGRHDRLRDERRARVAEGGRPSRGRRDRGRGHRPQDAPPARHPDRAHLRREDEPYRGGRGGAAHRRLGRRGASRASPRRASAISTTPGASPRRTAPCPTRPRSRTRSCPSAERIASEIRSRIR